MEMEICSQESERIWLVGGAITILKNMKVIRKDDMFGKILTSG